MSTNVKSQYFVQRSWRNPQTYNCMSTKTHFS